jgi:MFS family permease
VLRPYRVLLATPGGLAFSAAGLLARLPISMLGLGIVLLISDRTGSYGLAGAVSATFALTAALVAPMLARLVDRVGQARVLVPSLAVHVAAVLVLMACGFWSAPRWTLFVSAAVAGATMPNIGALVRARWSHLVRGTSRLHTAYSLESVLDEVIFIVGPVLVTVLATAVHPLAGLGTVVAASVIGGLVLAAQRRTEPPRALAGHDHRGSALRARGLPVIVVVFVALGSLFGSFEVVVVAFTSEEGQRGAAGLVLATYALGSMISGIGYGAVNWRRRLDHRFLIGATAMGISMLALPLVPGVPALAALAFGAGFAISPTLISGAALVQQLVPPGRLTEGLTWTHTGLGLGITVGAALSGQLIDAWGAQRAFTVATVSAASAALLAYAGASWLRPDGSAVDGSVPAASSAGSASAAPAPAAPVPTAPAPAAPVPTAPAPAAPVPTAPAPAAPVPTADTASRRLS